nr:DUF6651 domain-containing protein [uncultured Undibacterium sp.]
MKLKLDANGNVVVQDGKPVYVKDDGSEIAFDVAGTTSTIARLNAEAKTHREGKEAAEKALKSFEGISDPSAALKALETMSSLDQKKLIDAGEVEKVKTEISKAFEAKLTEATTRAQTLEQQLFSEKVGGAFSRSKMITEKLAIPPDLVEARFGKNFSIEEGKIVAKDQNGNKLYSPSNPGELANFDEALDLLVQSYPYKDQILKGSGASGSGAGSSQGNAGGKKTYTRAQFDSLDAVGQRNAASEVAKGTATLTD